jgi:hypothetical protein
MGELVVVLAAERDFPVPLEGIGLPACLKPTFPEGTKRGLTVSSPTLVTSESPGEEMAPLE